MSITKDDVEEIKASLQDIHYSLGGESNRELLDALWDIATSLARIANRSVGDD